MKGRNEQRSKAMPKVTITIEGTEEGVSIDTDFDPPVTFPLDADDEYPATHIIAMSMLRDSALLRELKDCTEHELFVSKAEDEDDA